MVNNPMHKSMRLLLPLLLAVIGSLAFAQNPPIGTSAGQGRDSLKWEVSLFCSRFRAVAGGAHGRHEVRRLGDQILLFHEEPASEGGLLGVRVDRRLSRWFAIEGSVAMADSPREVYLTRSTDLGPYQPPSPLTVTGAADLSAGSTYLVEGGTRFTLHRFRRLELFLTPGIGLTVRTGLGWVGLLGAPQIGLDSDCSGYLTTGPGVKFPLGRHWGMRGDVKTRWAQHDLSPSGGALYLDWTAGPYFEF